MAFQVLFSIFAMNFGETHGIIFMNNYTTLQPISEQQLRSYRLSSTEEPTDEMLHAIMEKVAYAAQKSSAHSREIHLQRLSEITVSKVLKSTEPS